MAIVASEEFFPSPTIQTFSHSPVTDRFCFLVTELSDKLALLEEYKSQPDVSLVIYSKNLGWQSIALNQENGNTSFKISSEDSNATTYDILDREIGILSTDFDPSAPLDSPIEFCEDDLVLHPEIGLCLVVDEVTISSPKQTLSISPLQNEELCGVLIEAGFEDIYPVYVRSEETGEAQIRGELPTII